MKIISWAPHILTAALILLCSTFASAQGIGLGAGPSDLFFGNLNRGGYAENTVVVSTTSKTNLSVTVVKEGEIADWLTISPMEFILPAESRKEVTVIIEPPVDAANRLYEGKLYIKASPIAAVGRGAGSAIGTRVAIQITANISGVETLDYKIIDAKVYDTEIGYPIEFNLKITNNGNVKTTPKIRFTLNGPAEKPEITTITRNASEIMPSKTADTVVTVPSSNLKVGKYAVEVGYFKHTRDPTTRNPIESYEKFDTLKFNVLPEGSMSAKGYLESLILDKTQAKAGETVKINAVFKNMGDAPLAAKLDCEILEGFRLEAKIDGKEVTAYPGQSKNLEAYYTTRTNGKYGITCFVSYGRYETPKKTVNLEVGGGMGSIATYIIIAVALVAAYAAYKKGYLGGGGKKGFQEV